MPPQEHYLDYVIDHVGPALAAAGRRRLAVEVRPPDLRAVRRRACARSRCPTSHDVTCRLALLRSEYGLVTDDIGASMYERLGRVTPVIEIPEAGHHAMLDQPLHPAHRDPRRCSPTGTTPTPTTAGRRAVGPQPGGSRACGFSTPSGSSARLTARMAASSSGVRLRCSQRTLRGADAVLGADAAAQLGHVGEHGLVDRLVARVDAGHVHVDVAVGRRGRTARSAPRARPRRTRAGSSSRKSASAACGTVTSSLCGGPSVLIGLGVVLAVPPQRLLGAPRRWPPPRRPRRVRADGRGQLVGGVGVAGDLHQHVDRPGRAKGGARPKASHTSSQAGVEEQLGGLEGSSSRASDAAAATAASTSANASSATTRSSWRATRRSRAAVTMPSVPSLPHSSDGRW